jgi:mono/diheme cytochrome c family protein
MMRLSILASAGVLALVSGCSSDVTSNPTDSTSSGESGSSSAGSSSAGSSSAGSSSAHTSSPTSTGSNSSSATGTSNTTTRDRTSEAQSSTEDATSDTQASDTDDTSGTSSGDTSTDGEDSSEHQSDSTESESTSSGETSSDEVTLSAYERLCATCHGATGDGVDELGPDIKHPVEEYSEWVIRNGRPDTTMLAFDTDQLSDTELAEILEFLADQPQPTTGEELYGDYCAACHGADGAGGPTTRPVIGEAHEAEQLVRNGHAGEFDNRREYMPKWTTDAISDAELDLIIAYIESF